MTLPRAALIAAAVAFAAAALGIPVRSTYGAQVSGDEPHYLLTAISLGEDGDLDVDDEIDADRYRAFHETDLDPQAQRLANDRRVAPHDPLLPAILALPMRAGGWVGAKLALAFVAGLLAAVLVATAVRRFAVRPATAALVVALFGASAPLAVYGHQVYPEIVAALVVASCLYFLTGELRPSHVAIATVGVIALPWLSIKYAPVAVAVAVVLLVRLIRNDGKSLAIGAAVAFVLAGAHYLAAHQLWYGGWTAYASGDHFVDGEFAVVGFQPNYIGRSRRLIGLLIDRDFGLAVWQPAYLLIVPALASFIRRRPPGWLPVTVAMAVGWLNATFVALTMQGWWFPGRQLVVILPCLVLALAWWIDRAGSRLVAVLGGLGVLSYGWLVVEGSLGRITWIVDFFETTNPVVRAGRLLFPDYLDVGVMTWVLQSAWLVALGAIAFLTYRGAGEGEGGTPSLPPSASFRAGARAGRLGSGAGPGARTGT